ETTIDTVTGSMVAESIGDPGGGAGGLEGGASGQAHGAAVARIAHDLARHRRLGALGAAQLAHDPTAPALEQVHLLAVERGAPAVGAAPAIGFARPHAAAQEQDLEGCELAVERRHRAVLLRRPERSCSCNERGAAPPGRCLDPRPAGSRCTSRRSSNIRFARLTALL